MAAPTDDHCYLTTTGRRTGQPHRIEIWYATSGKTIYLLAGGRRSSDWVQNLIADPIVTVEVGDDVSAATARVLDAGDEAERARALVHDKYATRGHGDLTAWRDRALVVAVDLT